MSPMTRRLRATHQAEMGTASSFHLSLPIHVALLPYHRVGGQVSSPLFCPFPEPELSCYVLSSDQYKGFRSL